MFLVRQQKTTASCLDCWRCSWCTSRRLQRLVWTVKMPLRATAPCWQPWARGLRTSWVFHCNRMGQLPMLPEVLDVEVCPHAVVDTQFFQLRRTVDSRSWEDKLNSHLVTANGKWAGIILIFPLAFDIGRNFVVNSGTMANGLHETLYDVFAGKSAGTLHNRANPMIRFTAWCRQNGNEPLPLDEEIWYRFASRSSTPPPAVYAPPARGKGHK